MPTTLPTSEPRLSPRQTARFLWLCIRVRYLRRRMERASAKAARVGFERAGGRFVHFARLWLECHDEAAGLLRCEVPPDVVEVRAIFQRQP